jgi:hypothetical protein
VFEKPSLEYGDAADSGIAILCDGLVSKNVFRDCYYESHSTGGNKVARFINGARDNLVTMLTYYGTITTGPGVGAAYTFDTGANPTDNCYGNDVKMSQEGPYQRVLDVTSFDAAYRAASQHIPGFEWIGVNSAEGVIATTKSSGIFTPYKHGNGVMLYDTSNYNAIGRMIGFLGTTNYPRDRPNKLYVRSLVANNQGSAGNIVVFCYDSTGALLTGSSPYYVKGLKASVESNHYLVEPMNPSYRQTYNVLMFDPSVVRVFIGVNGSTSHIGLDIKSPYSTEVIPIEGPQEAPGKLIASGSPTSPGFYQGTVVWNNAAAAGATPGWSCIKRLDTTLATNVANGGNTSITVADVTGFVIGDVIGITLNSGEQHFTTIAAGWGGSNPVTLTTAIPHTGLQASIGSAVVVNLWKAMPNL